MSHTAQPLIVKTFSVHRPAPRNVSSPSVLPDLAHSKMSSVSTPIRLPPPRGGGYAGALDCPCLPYDYHLRCAPYTQHAAARLTALAYLTTATSSATAAVPSRPPPRRLRSSRFEQPPAPPPDFSCARARARRARRGDIRRRLQRHGGAVRPDVEVAQRWRQLEARREAGPRGALRGPRRAPQQRPGRPGARRDVGPRGARRQRPGRPRSGSVRGPPWPGTSARASWNRHRILRTGCVRFLHNRSDRSS